MTPFCSPYCRLQLRPVQTPVHAHVPLECVDSRRAERTGQSDRQWQRLRELLDLDRVLSLLCCLLVRSLLWLIACRRLPGLFKHCVTLAVWCRVRLERCCGLGLFKRLLTFPPAPPPARVERDFCHFLKVAGGSVFEWANDHHCFQIPDVDERILYVFVLCTRGGGRGGGACLPVRRVLGFSQCCVCGGDGIVCFVRCWKAWVKRAVLIGDNWPWVQWVQTGIGDRDRYWRSPGFSWSPEFE